MQSADEDALAQRAYLTMRQRIVQGEFALGQVISRRTVAAEMGVSLGPASEALLRLECDGLLEKRARSGTRIRIPTRDSVAGHFVIREALEVQAAMLLAVRATPDEKTELLHLAARLDSRTRHPEGPPALHRTLHEKLHLQLAECTRCPALFEAVRKISALSSAWLSAIGTPGSPGAPGHHEALIVTLLDSSATDAAEAMRAHIRADAATVIQTLEPFFQLHREYKDTWSRTIRKPPSIHGSTAANHTQWAG